MDKTLAYSTALHRAPPESSRITMTIPPITGSGVASSNEVIKFDLPATSFANVHSSYLQFDCELEFTNTAAIPATDLGYVMLDGGALSCFKRVALYAGQGGAEISSINTDFDFVANSLVKRKGKTFLEQVGVNAMGMHPDVYEFRGNNSPTDSYYSAAALGKIPSLNVIAGAVPRPAGTWTSKPVKYAIPLSLLAGLMDIDNKLPLMFLGTTTVLRLELTLNDVARALYVAKSTAGKYASDVNFTYRIRSPELQLSLSNVGDAAAQAVKEKIYSKEGVHIKYTSITANSFSWPESSQNYSHNHAKSLLSLNGAVLQLRETAKLNEGVYWPSITACRRYKLNQIQWQIGPSSFPQRPMQFTSETYNGNAYLENYLTNDNKHKGLTLSYDDSFFVSSYHNPDKSGWEVGIQFASEMDRESDLFSGRDLRSGANTIITRLDRDVGNGTPAEAPALQGLMIYFAGQALILRDGTVFPPSLG